MKVNRKRGLVATVVAVVGIVLAVTGLVGADVGQPSAAARMSWHSPTPAHL